MRFMSSHVHVLLLGSLARTCKSELRAVGIQVFGCTQEEMVNSVGHSQTIAVAEDKEVTLDCASTPLTSAFVNFELEDSVPFTLANATTLCTSIAAFWATEKAVPVPMDQCIRYVHMYIVEGLRLHSGGSMGLEGHLDDVFHQLDALQGEGAYKEGSIWKVYGPSGELLNKESAALLAKRRCYLTSMAAALPSAGPMPRRVAEVTQRRGYSSFTRLLLQHRGGGGGTRSSIHGFSTCAGATHRCLGGLHRRG